MAIPDFQSIMLPLLEYLSDGVARSNAEIFEGLARTFKLTEQEKLELLPSGKKRVFVQRLGWAKAHLRGAGLIECPAKGSYTITEEGKDLLSKGLSGIQVKDLLQIKDYLNTSGKESDRRIPSKIEQTPQEQFESGYTRMMGQLTAELLKSVKECSPYFFERLVVDLLLAMGYGGSRLEAGSTTSKTADGGIDGIIKEDRLGLDVIYLQAKRWEQNVTRPEIQKFAGALQGRRARKGVFITTSGFTDQALEFAGSIENKIVLIDGVRLAELMIEHNVGVSVEQTYELKRIDSDYFAEE
ncbi:MAG: restriction endonuclease [Deltaproteobacteria bacterium]|nr:restriction endonuclease [Deltaproteobacteria bacterium]